MNVESSPAPVGAAFRRMNSRFPGWMRPGLSAGAVFGTGLLINHNGGAHSIGDLMAWSALGTMSLTAGIKSVTGRRGSPRLGAAMLAAAGGCAGNGVTGYAGLLWGIACTVLGGIIGYSVQGDRWDNLAVEREQREAADRRAREHEEHRERLADKESHTRITVAALGVEAMRVLNTNTADAEAQAHAITVDLVSRGLIRSALPQFRRAGEFDSAVNDALSISASAGQPGVPEYVPDEWTRREQHGEW